MSRSYKKPYITERNAFSPARGRGRRESAKAVRRKEDVGNYSEYKKLYNSWDLCDWKFYLPKDKKSYRK